MTATRRMIRSLRELSRMNVNKDLEALNLQKYGTEPYHPHIHRTGSVRPDPKTRHAVPPRTQRARSWRAVGKRPSRIAVAALSRSKWYLDTPFQNPVRPVNSVSVKSVQGR